MARLFIALALAKQQKDEVVNYQEQLKSFMEGIRWVKPEGLHLTLKFLGETDESRIEQIKIAMDEAAASLWPLRMTFGSTGIFPSPRKARILWIGLQEGGQTVWELALKNDKLLASYDFEPEKRNFKPHLTIGRVRTALSREAAERYLNFGSTFATSSNTVKEMILYESRLSPRGATYYVLHRAPFAC